MCSDMKTLGAQGGDFCLLSRTPKNVEKSDEASFIVDGINT